MNSQIKKIQRIWSKSSGSNLNIERLNSVYTKKNVFYVRKVRISVRII